METDYKKIEQAKFMPEAWMHNFLFRSEKKLSLRSIYFNLTDLVWNRVHVNYCKKKINKIDFKSLRDKSQDSDSKFSSPNL